MSITSIRSLLKVDVISSDDRKPSHFTLLLRSILVFKMKSAAIRTILCLVYCLFPTLSACFVEGSGKLKKIIIIFSYGLQVFKFEG